MKIFLAVGCAIIPWLCQLVIGISVSSYFTAVKLNYFRSYGHMQLISFEVPCDTWYLTVFLQPGKTSPECSDKAVYSILSPYGLPLVDFTEYPMNFLVTPQMNTQISFNMSTSVFELRSEILKPRCGPWYLGLVLRESFDEGGLITNKDLKKSCYYFVGGGFTSELIKDVPVLNIFGNNHVTLYPKKQPAFPIIDGDLKLVGFFKFKPTPMIVSQFSVRLISCYLNASGNWTLQEKCPVEIASRVSAPPSKHSFSDNIFLSCRYINISDCTLPLWPIWPQDSFAWHYLSIWANESEPEIQIELEFDFDPCRIMEAPVPRHQLANLQLGQENANALIEQGHLIDPNNDVDASVQDAELSAELLAEMNKTASTNMTTPYSSNMTISSISGPSTRIPVSYEIKFDEPVASRCLVAPEMTRLLVVTQSLYTPIYFMSDSTGLLGNRIPVEDGTSKIIPLKVDSKFDNGGTLRLRVFLDINKTSPDLKLKVCLQWRHVPLVLENRTDLIKSPCPFGYLQTLSSHNESNSTDVVAVPYPKSGTWFLAFYGECFPGANCTARRAVASFELYGARCVDSASNQCSNYGDCVETSSLAGRISACSCSGGYRGYGCTDARHAIADSYARTMFVTLSNLAFIPAIFLALNWGHFTCAFVYFYNMFFSTYYHWCDADMYSWCLTKPDALQYADFLSSVVSFWTTMITMSTLGHHTRLLLNVMGLLFMAFATSLDRFSLWTFLVPFLVAFTVMCATWIFRGVKLHRCYPPRPDWWRLLPGAILAGVALVIYAALETPENYEYTHGTWHILVMLSCCFLLPRPLKKNACFPTGQCPMLWSSKHPRGGGMMFPSLDKRFWRMTLKAPFWIAHVNSCCDFPPVDGDETLPVLANTSNRTTDDVVVEKEEMGQEMRVSPSSSPVQPDDTNTAIAAGFTNNCSTSSMSGLLTRSPAKSSHAAGDVVVRIHNTGNSSPSASSGSDSPLETPMRTSQSNVADDAYSRL